MADKPTIEIFRKKDAEDFTLSLSAPDSRAWIGSAAALTAAEAAALLHRAAVILSEGAEDERLDYLVRNSEILRGYMVRLIDEDVKCRGPLRRAQKEGDARTIEAAHEPAVAIAQEIVCMMGQAFGFLCELAERDGEKAAAELAGAAELAMGAVKASMRYVLFMSRASSDETYRFIVRRENELTLEQYAAQYERVLALTKL